MAKMQITMTGSNGDGENQLNAKPTPMSTGSNNRSYAPIDAGVYWARVTSFKEGSYKGVAKDGSTVIKNTTTEDGKWTYLKLTPQIEIPKMSKKLGDDGEEVYVEVSHTAIGRQDFVVGIVHEGGFYRPQEDGKSPIWTGLSGAFSMLHNLGFFSEHEGNIVLDYDPTAWKNRVCKVGLSYAAYKKNDGEKSTNWSPEDFRTWLAEEAVIALDGLEPEHVEAWNEWMSGDTTDYKNNMPIATVQAIVENFNKINDYGDEYNIRVKNEVTYWAAVSQDDAEYRGFYYDEATAQVFVEEGDYNIYQNLLALEEDEGLM